MLRDWDIVYVSCLDWGPIRQRPQQIALQLATTNRVLFVEPMISLVSQLARLLRQNRGRPLTPGLREIQSGLFLYTPPPFLPFSLRSEQVNSINKKLLLRYLRKTLSALGFDRPIVVLSHPSHHEVIGRLGEEAVFYDCMDHYTALPDRRANPSVLDTMERKLLEKVDLVFVTSERLQNAIGRYGAKGVIVRNGVDITHFAPHNSRYSRPDEELADIPRPIIGYIGCIDSWFDGDAIASLAASCPSLSIVLVGPVQDRAIVRQLRFSPNVYFLGPKPYMELPSYLDAFAVCLIPFQVNELTRAVNPVKLYEYFATGKPVVTAALDEIKRYQDIVRIYETREELIEQVERALKEQDQALSRLRVRVAGENTWRHRAEEMRRALAAYLALETPERARRRVVAVADTPDRC